MRTQLKVAHLSPERLLSSYVDRRLSFAVGRFAHRIALVNVRISGGEGSDAELVCRMSAEIAPFGVIAAEASDPDVYSAIDRCAARLARRSQSKCARPRSGLASRESVRMLGVPMMEEKQEARSK